MNRLLTISLNGLAFLVLGLAGAALANVLTINQLTVYGPVALGGLQTAIQFGSSSSALFIGDIVLPALGSGAPPFSSYYAVAPDLSNILVLANDAIGPLASGALEGLYSSALVTSAQLDTIVLLPADSSIFAVPLPSTASLMVCGFAALAFAGRVFRARRGRAA